MVKYLQGQQVEHDGCNTVLLIMRMNGEADDDEGEWTSGEGDTHLAPTARPSIRKSPSFPTRQCRVLVSYEASA